MNVIYFYVFRRHSIQAEGLPGLYSLSAAERRHPGPGGAGEDHTRGPTRLSGSLRQLRLVLPEPGPLCGASQWLPLRLWPVSVHWSLLPHRYSHVQSVDKSYCLTNQCQYVGKGLLHYLTNLLTFKVILRVLLLQKSIWTENVLKITFLLPQ